MLNYRNLMTNTKGADDDETARERKEMKMNLIKSNKEHTPNGGKLNFTFKWIYCGKRTHAFIFFCCCCCLS